MSEPRTFKESAIYTPTSLLQLFSYSLAPSGTRDLMRFRGIYISGRGANYSGYYYDTIKDEIQDAQLTLLVPVALRRRLIDKKVIEFYGWIVKRVVPAGGRVELHVGIADLIVQTESKVSEKDIKALTLLQVKATKGYRDVDGFIKSKIVRQERVSITILVGRTAIVDSDIKHALGEVIGFYDVRFERFALNSEFEILAALDRFNDTGLNELLVLSRGGGDNLAIFNSPEIAERCLGLEPFFLTAIGHKEDVTLVQRVADKAFITPTDLGQWLRTIYNETILELENSKAKLVETISTQFRTSYEKRVQDLEQKARSLEELDTKNRLLHERELQGLKQQVQDFQNERSERETLIRQISSLEERARTTQRTNQFLWLILAALVLFIGVMLLRK